MNIALLIDADNTQLSKLDAIIRELNTRGTLSIRRAYANWSKPHLSGWHKILNHYAIKAEQQFDYAIDKNATDMALTIDALDLLYTSPCDAFAIVSSDSDFTPLAIRLRESNKHVIGIGRQQTPGAFRNSCTEFIILEELAPKDDTSPSSPADDTPEKSTQAKFTPEPPTPTKPTPACPATEAPQPTQHPHPLHPQAVQSKPLHELSAAAVHKALRLCAASKAATDRFVLLPQAGDYLHSLYPDHRLKFAEHSKLLAFIEAHSDLYEVKKDGPEPAQSVWFRCIDNGSPLPAIPQATIHAWLRHAVELSTREDHYATIGHAGSHLHRLARAEGKEFNVKQYGFPKLVNFIRSFPKLYSVREKKQNGVTIYEFTCHPQA